MMSTTPARTPITPAPPADGQEGDLAVVDGGQDGHHVGLLVPEHVAHLAQLGRRRRWAGWR